MTLAWVVFIVQLFNVVTRYGTRYVEQDILIGQATSLAWQSFAALFLLGVNYGIRDGVNPRIDFWWANFTDKTKASIDFVLHTLLFLPFVFMAIRILQPYAAIALGRKRDGTWPSGYRVWETWEQSSDADQLPVGPIKALLLVGFVLIGIQLISELIKTGFVIAGRRRYGNLASSDAPLRIE
jgi:TRAP-type mannitol/chloroaromatic compound transport system permease small subunit